MKEFKKTTEGLFICEECGKICKNLLGLTTHLRYHHNKKEYYEKWLKEENEEFCAYCGKELQYDGLYPRAKYCNQKCMSNSIVIKQKIKNTKLERYGDESYHNMEKSKQTKLERYGNEHYFNRKKSKQTKLERYGDENYSNTKKSKQTKLERYGDEGYHNIEKMKQTNLDKHGVEYSFIRDEFKELAKQTCLTNYGVEYPSQSNEIQEKIKQTKLEKYGDETYHNKEQMKQTCLKKYGVEHPNQIQEQYNKGLKTRLLLHKYKDTNLTYQGTYELDFLNIYSDKIDIENALSIKYIVNNKNKVYHPDFYIPSLNLIVEIKSTWILKLDENIEIKKKTTITNGFNYLMILN